MQARLRQKGYHSHRPSHHASDHHSFPLDQCMTLTIKGYELGRRCLTVLVSRRPGTYEDPLRSQVYVDGPSARNVPFEDRHQDTHRARPLPDVGHPFIDTP